MSTEQQTTPTETAAAKSFGTFKVIGRGQLKLSAVNMRHGKTKPDVSDLVADIRRRGIMTPLCVRPNCDGYEIIAGRRRYFAAAELGLADVPCIVTELDDAEALEASYAENFRRVDPDPLTQFETFSRLVALGQSPAGIAATFGLPELTVKRRLAIANLVPGVRRLIRDGALADSEIQALTLATRKQQQEWLRLYGDGRAPRHHSLRRWVMDAGEIPAEHALFERDAYTGEIISDLFQEQELFADVEQFWKLQNEAVAALVEKYQRNKWPGVHLLEPGERFERWYHHEVAKKDGGHVWIEVRRDGEVVTHEGYLTTKQLRALERADAKGDGAAAVQDGGSEAKAAKNPELSTKLDNYVNHHKARAVGVELAGNRHLALRYAAALLLRGNANVRVQRDQTPFESKEIEQSVSAAPATTALLEATQRMAMRTGIDVRAGVMNGGGDDREATPFGQLLTLTDKQVIDVIALALAHRLEVGGGLVDILGEALEVDMRTHWTPDEIFFEMIRDKAVIGGMLAEVAGKKVADANITATGKVKKGIIRDFLAGTNGRQKVADWLPRWMRFPVAVYERRTGVRSLKRAADARTAFIKAKKD